MSPPTRTSMMASPNVQLPFIQPSPHIIDPLHPGCQCDCSADLLRIVGKQQACNWQRTCFALTRQCLGRLAYDAVVKRYIPQLVARGSDLASFSQRSMDGISSLPVVLMAALLLIIVRYLYYGSTIIMAARLLWQHNYYGSTIIMAARSGLAFRVSGNNKAVIWHQFMSHSKPYANWPCQIL